MSDRGLDVTDEGFYLLSYRWWDSNPYTFTGVQYLFGPVYEALGYDVQELRLVRLGLILATHTLLGLAAVSWIRATTTSTIAPRSRAVIVLAVVAAGGIIVAWGPLSPGYNDVGVLASILMAAGALKVHGTVSVGGALPWTVAAGLGPVVVALALAKWSSALVAVPFVLGAMAVAVLPQRPRGAIRWGLILLVSVAVTGLLVHALVKPLPDIVEPIVVVTGRLSAGSNAPADLLVLYATSTARVVLLASVSVALVALVLVSLSRFTSGGRRTAAAAAPFATLLVAVALSGGLSGGVRGIAGYVTVLLAVVATVWLISWFDREGPPASAAGSRAMVALLVLLPGVQALGTGNALYVLAVNGFALWMVVLLRAWAQRSPDGLTRHAAAAGVAASLIAVGWVAVSGVLAEPYRTASYTENTVSFHSPSIGELRLDPDTAAGFRRLQATAPNGVPTMAFDEMAGVVLVLDGRPVGEAWYSAIDRDRTAAGIVSYCASREDPWGSGLPVVAFNRPVSDVERGALDACGLSLDTDYTPVRVPTTIEPFTVYLPREVE